MVRNNVRRFGSALLGRGVMAAALAISIQGCSEGSTTLDCTEIGCGTGLTVALAAPLAAGAEIVVEAEGLQPRSLTCGVNADCTTQVYFDEVVAEEVTITIRSGGSETAFDVEPVYEQYQPNGPLCEPLCERATVQVANQAE